MRTTKYRAWDKEQKRMIAVSNLSFGDDGSALTVIIWDRTVKGYDRPLVVGENAELMQFTGRLDKRGQEIYEYDFIQRPDIGIPMLVRWNEKNAGFDLTMRDPKDFDAVTIWYTYLSQTDYEIIGNFYEHPELLAKQK